MGAQLLHADGQTDDDEANSRFSEVYEMTSGMVCKARIKPRVASYGT